MNLFKQFNKWEWAAGLGLTALLLCLCAVLEIAVPLRVGAAVGTVPSGGGGGGDAGGTNSRQFGTATLTNLSNGTNLGQLYVTSDLVVAAGIGAASNAWIGGTYYQEIGTAFTNLNGTPATLTNLATVSIAGHTLTNTGDRLVAEWGIVLQIAKANTNRFQIFYGGATVLDTGLQISSNCTVRAGCTIARKTGLNSQHVEAWLHWGPAAVPFVFTNTNFELAENNGVANTLGMKGSSQAVGAHTNNYFVVEWKPGSR